MASTCGNDKEHRFHHFEKTVRLHCTGKTDCGTKLHESHFFEKVMRAWCPGVCLCGSGRGEHGPGEHK